MNISQAKQLDLADFLNRLGYQAVENRKGQLWFLSPFRHESQPSFKVNPELNAWYDFGEGVGGDILDFVKRYQNTHSVSQSLAYIRQTQGNQPLQRKVQLPMPKVASAPALQLTSMGSIRSRSLMAYLKQRGISLRLAASRLRQAHYQSGDKPYFALAFANDAGGSELRNPMWKGTLGKKDITTIPAKTIDQVNTDRVSVFEGFFDYLTAVTLHGKALDHAVIVLNSVAFRDRAAEKLRLWGTRQLDLYRDNDTAGAALLAYLQQELPDVQVIDKAESYAGFDDLNQWHCNRLEREQNVS